MKNGNLIEQIEQRRLEVQAALDGAKTQAERNRLGQFATPPALALEILNQAKRLLPSGRQVRFIDPSLGTGSFFSAFTRIFEDGQRLGAFGCEVDPDFATAARQLWQDAGLDVREADFTKQSPPEKLFDLLICNPPYVRHHHIVNGEKARIQSAAQKACGLRFGGLAGLYCYFLGLSHAWMSEGGLAGWLIPSEFMDVNYGAVVKDYLLNKVRLIHIHRFDPNDVQFGDALVSSAVVWFRKETPPDNYEVEFSFGGTLLNPKVSRQIPTDVLRKESKWTRFPLAEARNGDTGHKLSDYFSIRRGLATGDNDFFILSGEQIASLEIPSEFYKPILPSPRYLDTSEIEADDQGVPLLEKPLYLLDCCLSEEKLKVEHVKLWRYLQEGKERGVAERYLCKHRTPWYSQENRPAAPFICTYLGRNNGSKKKPFRFILNRSSATITNVYLALYPKERIQRTINDNPSSMRRIWEILNAICPQDMLDEGRVYGGGLHKLEPKELANVPVPALAEVAGKSQSGIGENTWTTKTQERPLSLLA